MTFSDLIDSIVSFFADTLVDLLLTLAVVAFMFSVLMFMFNRARGNTDAIQDAKNQLMWSIVGLFVMFSVWGIISFFQEGFGIEDKQEINVPKVRNYDSSKKSN